MQAVVTLMLESVQRCKRHNACNQEAWARQLRKLNNVCIAHCIDDSTDENVVTHDEFVTVVLQFAWLTPCCKESCDAADAYNTNHVTGLVLCKLLHVLVHDELDQEHTVQALFPAIQEMHMCSTPIAKTGLDELLLVTASFQRYWRRAVAQSTRACAELIVLLMARMGNFLLFHTTEQAADKCPHVEEIKPGSKWCRPRKKTVRSFLCAILGMLRALALAHGSTKLQGVNMADEEKTQYLQAQGYSEVKQRRLNICPEIHHSIMRIKTVRGNSCVRAGTREMQDEDLWRHISSKLGQEAVGDPPRKFTHDLNVLMRDVCVFCDAAPSYFAENAVLTECVRVLETALRSFYVVPAMDTWKKLSLQRDLRPGQRVCYAHDYTAFDTGDITQVIYLNAPMYVPNKPPSCVEEWGLDDFCGPISAFMQLDPTTRVHLEDEEDPLGFLRQPVAIRRPADYNTTQKNAGIAENQTPRFIFVLNHNCLYLVDRSNANMYTSDTQCSSSHNHTLYLLCLYVFLTNSTSDVCKTAVSSFKVSSSSLLQGP